MAFIVLVRHGESEGNAQNIVSGTSDVPLTAAGKQQARQAAYHVRHISLHKAHVSQLRRTQETLVEITKELNIPELPTVAHAALNERDFGTLTGRAKHELIQELGDETYATIVSGWDTPAPGGESLKMVHDRVVPYFKEAILTDAMAGKNVIVSAHRQTLRALIKYLEHIPADKIAECTLKNAEVIIYAVDEASGAIKRVR